MATPRNWVRHQLVVSSTDPADLMRRHGQRMETVLKRVSQTPRSGSRAQQRASLSDSIRNAWHSRSAAVTGQELKTNSESDGDPDLSIKYRSSEQVQSCCRQAGHEAAGTCDLKLVSQKPGPFAQISAPPFPAAVSGQGGIPVPAHRPTDGEAGWVNQCLLPPRPRAPGSSWPPGVFLERQDCHLDKAPPRATFCSHLRAPPVGRPQAAGPGKGWPSFVPTAPLAASWGAQSHSRVPGTAGSPGSEPLRGDTHPLLMSSSQT